MIRARTTFLLGLAQLISWGISYYLIGCFGERMAADLGFSRAVIYGGYSVSLLVMGLSSPRIGLLIDRFGGRPMMTAGSCLNAIGCAALAMSHTVPAYYAGWIVLGLAMRLTLYDAAFASLARIGGPEARRPMAQITLLGGLASTVLWPVGHMLATRFGWRVAVLAYAGFALLTVPLHLALPRTRYSEARTGAVPSGPPPLAAAPRERALAGFLYALIAVLTGFLNAGMSAHLIGILSGLGLTAAAAVWIAALRGIGQSSARLAEVLFGGKLHPLDLNLSAAVILPFAFTSALGAGAWSTAAVAFTFLYGAGNGIVTITRGTLPLVLFDLSTYGAFIGRLLSPSFLLSAAAPTVYAFVIERAGEAGAVHLSIAAAIVIFLSALALRFRYSPRRA